MPTDTSPETDREALVALFNATGGENWTGGETWNRPIDPLTWLTDAPLGEWDGVTTNGNGRVTVLDLYDSRLSGEIPAELGNLTNLKALFLHENELSGEIPVELGNLANLEVLVLFSNAERYRQSWAISPTWKFWSSSRTS